MSFIHQSPDWPRFTWESEPLTSLLATVRFTQGHLLGTMQGLGFQFQNEASLGSLTANVVQSSAIEGEVLNAEEVRSSLARQLGLETPGLAGKNRQIEAVVEMMLDATQNYGAPLTHDRLHAWHAALFPTGRSGLYRITTGAYRTDERGPMQVVSGQMQSPKVHFEAPVASRVEPEMQAFLEWFERPSDLDPILRSAIAHFWFITIHPFEDGNGRMARAIADMALARADGASQRFYSMSAQILIERKEYYRVLEFCQRGQGNIHAWMDWYLRCLGRALDAAQMQAQEVLERASVWAKANEHPLNDRQRRVLARLLDDFEGPLTNAKYTKLAKCSQDTALRDIQALVSFGLLQRNEGKGRSVSYGLATKATTVNLLDSQRQ